MIVPASTDGNRTASTASYTIAGQPEVVNDGKGDTVYSYDNSDPSKGPIERRGLVTGQSTQVGSDIPSTWTVSYTAGGSPWQTHGPIDDLVTGYSYSTVGQPVLKAYATPDPDDENMSALAGSVVEYDEFGQTVTAMSVARFDGDVESKRGSWSQNYYSYDKAGRYVTSLRLALSQPENDQPATSTISSFEVNTYTKDSVRAKTTDMVYPIPDGQCVPAADGCLPTPTFDTPLSSGQVEAVDAWLHDPANAWKIQKTVRSTNYNKADQLLNTIQMTTNKDVAEPSIQGAYRYDDFARTTWLPAVDTVEKSSDAHAEFGYYLNDLAHTQTRAGTTQTFTLDPVQRFAGSTITPAGGSESTDTQVNHYSDSSDSPAWIQNTTTNTWQRYISSPDGGLAMTATGTGTNTDADSAVLNLTSLHGDVIASIPATDDLTYPTSFSDYTAFGAPINTNTTPATPPAPYGWEGANQRSNHAQTGIIMMGVRQYNPTTGTFLTQDPIPGGNANAYTYPTDPIGGEDLDGRIGKFGYRYTYRLGPVQHVFVNQRKYVANYLKDNFGSIVPPIGSNCGRMNVGTSCSIALLGRIKVVKSTRYSFTVENDSPHVEGPGTRRLKFKIIMRSDGYLYLRTKANGPWTYLNYAGPFASWAQAKGIQAAWGLMAGRLRQGAWGY